MDRSFHDSLQKVTGAYALVVNYIKDPTMLIAAKTASPLVVGLGEDENFIWHLMLHHYFKLY